MTAVKHDGDKAWRPELLAPEMVRGVSTVLEFGARKYSAGNWAHGMAWSRPFGAMLRHLFAWAGGQRLDSESGLPHLWHAGCCLMFLIAYEERGIGSDDRGAVGIMSTAKVTLECQHG